ncbi:hypothetical protein, partial [Candidatus Magnetobacterium casense]
MNDNDLRIIIYSSGTVVDTQMTGMVKDHTGLSFDTIYPGGLYSQCRFFVAGDPTKPHPSISNKRIEILNGLKTLWEGQIDILQPTIQGQNDGYGFECTGYWGAFLGRSRWDKVWCDTRISDDIWEWQVTGGTESQFKLDRYNRLRFMPGNEVYVNTDYAAVRYVMPTSQAVNHITGNYDLNEGIQNWYLQAWDVAAGTAFGSVTASGTGSFDWIPASAGSPGTVDLRFCSGASQTGDIDNLYYGELSNIKVYGEAGTISSTEVLKDFVGHFTGLNVDTNYIAANTVTHEPCFMQWEPAAEFIAKLAAFGDTSYNPWSAGVKASSVAGTPNGKPVLYFEQQPSLSGYDYVLRLDEIDGQVTLDQVFDEITNAVIVEYTDANGNSAIKSHLDDSTLQDNTSGAAYGWRYTKLSLGNVGETEALNYARRYLAWFKDPKWRMSSPIVVRGTIR